MTEHGPAYLTASDPCGPEEHTECDGCGWKCYEEELNKNVNGAKLCRECIADENNMSVGELIAFLSGKGQE